MLQRGTNPPPEGPEPTIASLFETYLDSARKRLAERSLYERRLILQRFAEAHGFRKVAECLPYHLSTWVDANPQWASDWTIAQVISVVMRPLNWAVQQRLIAANPFKGVTRRQGQPRRPMTDEEFQALLRATAGRRSRKTPTPGARFRQVLFFLRYTGCRPNELCRLRWPDIDLDNAVIVLAEHKASRTQRVPKPRVVPLHPVVVRLLASIRRRQEPGEFVFLTHRLTPWNRCSLSLRMQRAREKAGLPDVVKLYGLRHGFGTRSILNGLDLVTLSALMGHATTRMTEHYVHVAGQREHLAAAMRRANARRPGS
jgi:integrase